MQFYRPATKEDFDKGYVVNLSHFERTLPKEIELLIESGETNKAINVLRQQRGYGIRDCKNYCETYAKFLQAKKDFLSGKPVFVVY